MKQAALWGVELLVTRGTQIEKNTFDRFQDIFIRIIWLLKNYIPGPHPQKLLIWQTWDGTWRLAWKTGLEQCGTVERSDAFGKPRILYPSLAVHTAQELDKGSEKSCKEGIYLILINSLVSRVECRTLSHKRRGRLLLQGCQSMSMELCGAAAFVGLLYFMGGSDSAV